MQKHSRFSLITNFVLILFMISFNNASQEALIGDNFIKNYLFCVEQNDQIIHSTRTEHYFQMFRTNVKTDEVTSFGDIAEAAEQMLVDWDAEYEQMLRKFKANYLSLNTYTSGFYSERFSPIANFTWLRLKEMFTSEERFVEWEDDRSKTMTMDQYTNLVPPHKNLIEEFEVMQSKLDLWGENYMNLNLEIEVDPVEQFNMMKAKTIQYLALIFIAGFEYEKDQVFYTEDNTLLTFWSTFHPWLNLNQCNGLVNMALAGKLGQVKTIDILNKLLSTQVGNIQNPVQLVYDGQTLANFAQQIDEIKFLQKNNGEWKFYTEENLNDLHEMNMDDGVSDRINFDKIRIEKPKDCLEFIADMEGFVSLKSVFKQANKFMVENFYYYFIEYLLLRASTTPMEFTDEVRRVRAVQIIYIFMNKILNDDYPKMKQMQPGQAVLHVIIRILKGLGEDGDLRDLIDSGYLDETTENYIYMLLFIITENNDIPKPEESEELDRLRDESEIDEDEPNFKIDVRNNRFAYIIRRVYALAGNSKTAGYKYVARYKKKHYQTDLLEDNEIFKLDNNFFLLEQKMNLAYTGGDFEFTDESQAYEHAKNQYFEAAIEKSKNVNVPMFKLVKYFITKYNELVKKQPPSNIDPNKWLQDEYNKLFLEKLGLLKSNFMEMEYVKAVIFAINHIKKDMPQFDYLLTQKLKDNDKINLFEFMKRILTSLKHIRSQNRTIVEDTVDIESDIYDDQSAIFAGERFHTMLLDIEYYFGPKLKMMMEEHNQKNGPKVEYRDLKQIMVTLEDQFNMKKGERQSENTVNFRLMMTWNIFDDIEEYMPLISKFIEETKTNDMQGSNALKMEMLVENYTNMYIAILEHRIFAATNSFSFGSPEERIENMLAYLMMVHDQYNAMFEQPLPDKEIRFSKLDARQVENLIYFMNYRRKAQLIEQKEDDSSIVMSSIYFPYAFREIYVLTDNHPELRSILETECKDILTKLKIEKNLRADDYSQTKFTEEDMQNEQFRFCILMQFNRDMIDLIESQATINNGRDVMLTLTRESIFQALIVPYYDKLPAHDLVIQVFNINMSHAKAAARESAEKFSNYIALLDTFLLILDDLEDGRNDTMEIENIGSNEINEIMKNFCLGLERTDEGENRRINLMFIRHMLLEKLQPKFLAPGKNLKDIYNAYTQSPVNTDKVNEYLGRLRYGILEDQNVETMGLNPKGSEIDGELLTLLLIYAPHNEFTVELLYLGNFMSKLPQFVRMAQDNIGYLNKDYKTPKSMPEVFELAYNRKIEILNRTKEGLDKEATLAFDQEYDFDLGFDNPDDLDNHGVNSMWESEEIVINQNSLESNNESTDKLTKVLIGTSVEKIELNSSQSHLDGKEIFIDHIMKKSHMESDVNVNKIVTGLESSLEESQMSLNGINVVSTKLQYAENAIDPLNIVKQQTGHQSSLSIEDHNPSLNKQFQNEAIEDEMQSKIKTMIRLNFKGNSQEDMSAQMKEVQDAAKRLITKFNPEQCKVTVSGSEVNTSQKLNAKMTTHLSKQVSAFNMTNEEVHISGSHNAKINMVEHGVVEPIVLTSGKFNQSMNSSEHSNQTEMKKIIATGIKNIAKSGSQNFLRLV